MSYEILSPNRGMQTSHWKHSWQVYISNLLSMLELYDLFPVIVPFLGILGIVQYLDSIIFIADLLVFVAWNT